MYLVFSLSFDLRGTAGVCNYKVTKMRPPERCPPRSQRCESPTQHKSPDEPQWKETQESGVDRNSPYHSYCANGQTCTQRGVCQASSHHRWNVWTEISPCTDGVCVSSALSVTMLQRNNQSKLWGQFQSPTFRITRPLRSNGLRNETECYLTQNGTECCYIFVGLLARVRV
jgi:hypothetical protein